MSNKRKRRFFTIDFKREVAKYTLRKSVKEASLKYDICKRVIYRWRLAYLEEIEPNYKKIRSLEKTLDVEARDNTILRMAYSIPHENRTQLFEFIKKFRKVYPVCRMCSLLGYSERNFYRKLKYPNTKRALEKERFTKLIKGIYEKSKKRYGYRRITVILKARGHKISKHRVHDIMKSNGWKSRKPAKIKNTTRSQHSYKYFSNLIRYQHKAKKLNEIWVSDISFIKVAQKWLYLIVIIDYFNREVVGWSLTNTLYTRSTVMTAFEMAISRRSPSEALIFHSDRGVQYASDIFKKKLQDYPFIKQSMSAKGCCWENAVAESFFKTFKQELEIKNLDYDVIHNKISNYIKWYNEERLHSFLGYQSPVNFVAVRA